MHYKHNEISISLKLGTTLGVLSFLLISWLFIAKIDIIANTIGKIIPDGKNQTISVLETSSIEKVLVKEGDIVKKGQKVALLDNTNMLANHQQVNDDLILNTLRMRGINALLNNKSFEKLNDDDANKYQQIQSEMNSRKLSYESNLLALQSESLQAKNEVISSKSNLEKLENSRGSWEHQAESYKKLKETGFISPLMAEEKLREATEKIGDLKVQRELLMAGEAKIRQSQFKIQLASSDYKQQLLKELTEINQKIQNLKQENIKTAHNIEVRVLTSPIDGIVKDIVTNSPKAVLNEGNTLMTIVPNDDVLKADVIVKNNDIGYIEEGQKVKIKLETFAFQKYGLIEGIVEKISPDSTEDKDTKQNNYHIILKLNKNYLEKDEKKYFIKTGMTVNADIVISRRSIFEYLTSPLQKTILESGHER